MSVTRFIWSSCLFMVWAGSVFADGQSAETSFNNGGVQLSATLLTPSVEGPYPGVVMIGGSGPSTRDSLGEYARVLNGMGLAVLMYDKRGSGSSGGNWINSTLLDLAGDAREAFRLLATQAGIDPQRMGYWGISQGGWVAPLAAVQTPAAFVIAVTGGGMKPRETETFAYLNSIRHLGGELQDEADCRQLLDHYFAYLSGDIARDVLMNEMENYRESSWLEKLGIERVVPSESNRINWAWVATFDPHDSIAALEMPVLTLLGGKDQLAPAIPSATSWVAALPGTTGSRVTILPGAGHGLRVGNHGGSLRAEARALHESWLTEIGVLQ